MDSCTIFQNVKKLADVHLPAANQNINVERFMEQLYLDDAVEIRMHDLLEHQILKKVHVWAWLCAWKACPAILL